MSNRYRKGTKNGNTDDQRQRMAAVWAMTTSTATCLAWTRDD